MGAKSVSAVQVKTGEPAPPAVVSSDCLKLEARNEERRAALSEASNDQSIVGPSHSGKGTTMSSC